MNKHNNDIANFDLKNSKETEIVRAFRYVSYSELTENKLEGEFKKYKKIVKKKLGTKYNNFFSKLKNNLTNQKNFADELKNILNELGFYESGSNQNDSLDHQDDIDQDDTNNKNTENDNQESKIEADYDIESSSPESQQVSTSEGEQELGDDANENELDYFPKIELFDQIKGYKFFTNEFDEIIKAEELCDLKELDRLRLSLDQQVFSFKPLIAKIANRLQRKLQAQQNRQWEFNLEEGYLDTSRLAKIVTNPNHKLSFK